MKTSENKSYTLLNTLNRVEAFINNRISQHSDKSIVSRTKIVGKALANIVFDFVIALAVWPNLKPQSTERPAARMQEAPAAKHEPPGNSQPVLRSPADRSCIVSKSSCFV